MPSPKMMRPPLTAGELTIGSLRYGVDLAQRVRFSAFAPVSRQAKCATLKAPRLETSRRSFVTTGEATKSSFDSSDHSTLGFAGPGLPSVQPVRSLLPR